MADLPLVALVAEGQGVKKRLPIEGRGPNSLELSGPSPNEMPNPWGPLALLVGPASHAMLSWFIYTTCFLTMSIMILTNPVPFCHLDA